MGTHGICSEEVGGNMWGHSAVERVLGDLNRLGMKLEVVELMVIIIFA